MSFIPTWMLKLAGFSSEREQRLARRAQAAESRELLASVTEHEERFRAESTARARSPHVTLGNSDADAPYRVTLRSMQGAHWWITAGTGSGKSRLAASLLSQLGRAREGDASWARIVFDMKGGPNSLADLVLRSAAAHAAQLPLAERAAFLRRIVVVRPFAGDWLVPWQMLVREDSVSPTVQAAAMADVLEATLSVGTGIRQTSALTNLLTLAITEGWSALDVRFALYDPVRLTQAAARSSLPGLRAYFAQRFGGEGRVTVDGLAARFDALLAIDDLRGMLAGPGTLDLRRCFEPGALTVFDLGGVPMGAERARSALGALIFARLIWAVFDSRRTLDTDTFLLCDELQLALSPHVVSALDNLVSLARSFRVALGSAHQSAEQIPQELRAILSTNIRFRVLGQSGQRDAALALEALPITGLVPRPRRPGAPRPTRPDFLSENEEQRMRIAELATFPRQRFVVAERGASFPSQYIHATDFDPPSWDSFDPALVNAVLRGALGQPRAALVARAKEIEEEAYGVAARPLTTERATALHPTAYQGSEANERDDAKQSGWNASLRTPRARRSTKQAGLAPVLPDAVGTTGARATKKGWVP